MIRPKPFHGGLLSLLLAASVLHAQENTSSGTTNTGDNGVITFSFKPGETDYLTFNRSFPFDQAFIIRFTEVDDKVKNIKITLRQVQPHQDKIMEIVKEWTRPPSGDDIKVADVVIEPLFPNTSYAALVEYGYDKDLSDEEKRSLGERLSADRGVQKAYSSLVDGIGKGTLQQGDEIRTKIIHILEAIRMGIPVANPGYRLTTTTDEDMGLVITEVGKFRNPVRNVTNNLNTMKADNTLSEDQKRQVNVLQKVIEAISWSTITKGDDAFRQIDASAEQLHHELAANIRKQVADAIDARDAIPNDIINKVVLPHVYQVEALNQTFLLNFVENARLYVNLDVGYAYVSRVDRGMAYSGANIYFRPINRNIPLSMYRKGKDWWTTRLSLLLGISMGSIEKENVRKGFVGNNALVLGTGLRFAPFIKVNTGCFIHYRYDSNPLLSKERYHTSLSPFISLSVDLDAKTLFSGIGDSIFR